MLVGSHVRQAGMTRSTFRGAGLFVETAFGWSAPGRTKNRLVGEGATDRKAAVPNGYVAPHAWLLPVAVGGLSSSGGGGAGTVAVAGSMGLGAESSITGTGDLSATGKLVVSAVASILGSGEVTDADARAYLIAVATLAGSGDLVAAVDALGHAVAALAGEGTLSHEDHAGPSASGDLAAAITPFAELSAESLAAAVWSSPEGRFLYAVAHHRVVTDPSAGTYAVYDDDDATVLFTADLWEDSAGTVAYQGSGAERRDRFA